MIYAAGLDFGTSGARITILDEAHSVVAEHRVVYEETIALGASRWLRALTELFAALPAAIRSGLAAIALNGTSATVLLCDHQGQCLTAPLLYNDDRARDQLEPLKAIAPAGSPAASATSSLVKLLWWRATLPQATWQKAHCLLHQADWLAFQLHGVLGLSDHHNALKLGYDVGSLRYPDWLMGLGIGDWLPQVQAPGALFGYVSPQASDRYGLSQECAVFAGTTDSIAAFLASGARSPGEAVTSLGSTLVIKLLSEIRVDDSRYGIYSHRLGDLWLVGGASNTGGAVLKHFFDDEALITLSNQIDPAQPSPLNYYPLLEAGERFPISDPTFAPQLTPRPEDPTAFLHGLLEGIARIEALGYKRLIELGASPPTRILTAGGGAANLTWQGIRQRWLPAPVAIAPTTEAAFGSATLALEGRQALDRG